MIKISSTSCKGQLSRLVDCNSFYASCEQVFRPDLRGKPVVVLSNNDGCIIARSAEAKKLGIPMGEAFFKVQGLIKAHNVTVFSSNFALYGDLSARVMATMETICPEIEQYSIDEAFIPMPGALAFNAEEIAATLKETVYRLTCIPVSVGIAPTKTLAKVANHIAKKDTRVCVLRSDYAKAGVMLYDLIPVRQQQCSLLPGREVDPKRMDLMAALDKINGKHGRGSLKFGAEGLTGQVWKMKQNNLSPRFTTEWDELAPAYCK